MFNPWLLLVFVLALGASGGSGFVVGQRYERAGQLVAKDAELKSAHEAAVVDMEAAKEWGETNATADAAAREILLKEQLDAAKKSRPLCARDSDSMQLLDSAIDRVNGITPNPALRLPDTVLKGSVSTGRSGIDGTQLGSGVSTSVWGVRPAPLGVPAVGLTGN